MQSFLKLLSFLIRRMLLCREAVDEQPSTSRAAGQGKLTADLTAAQLSRNQELTDKVRGKVVSLARHSLAYASHHGCA